MMAEYGQEFSEAAISDLPLDGRTCAIVEHLLLLRHTGALTDFWVKKKAAPSNRAAK